jgi:hypothetical protein
LPENGAAIMTSRPSQGRIGMRPIRMPTWAGG